MAESSFQSLAFGWWNTGLSPALHPGRATAEQRGTAADIVQALLRAYSVDCLALGEVGPGDLDSLYGACDGDRYEVVDLPISPPRLPFDVALIVNREKLLTAGSVVIIDEYATHRLKVARRVDFAVPGTELPLHVFVSHWPSRLWCSQNQARRDTLGVRLRDAVQQIKALYGAPAQIVLLGDYNDEPFDEPLAGHLLASRDRGLVKRRDAFLYNPFWRHLGERVPHVPAGQTVDDCGTCFHRAGEDTKWRRFDQIIFSSAFLTGEEWQLDERYTSVLSGPPLDSLVRKRGAVFDHFPVISVLQRVALTQEA